MKFLKIQGIKCDNCDYCDDDAYWGESAKQIIASADSWLTKNCPICNAPLLTKPDYTALKILVRVTQVMYPFNVLALWFGRSLRIVDVSTDGTGTVTIKEKITNG